MTYFQGNLPDREEIVIKRLSASSRQGHTEFKSEVKLIARLQHKAYWFWHWTRRKKYWSMSTCSTKAWTSTSLLSKSLPRASGHINYVRWINHIVFYGHLYQLHCIDSNKVLLNCKRWFCIFQGVAQGLVYLHKYLRLRVIHRDLKPSNILLDNEMNPKISDFSLARIFASKVSEENTSRLVGT